MPEFCPMMRTGCVRIGLYSRTMPNETILEAQRLTKRFTVKKKTVEAVTDLSFQVAAGELVAFLGPNGAGKSTSLRMLTTLLPPPSGSARVVGHAILRQPNRKSVREGK